MEHMVGFRDPNMVPIKEFYDPSTKLNYMAAFVVDRSVQTRICFYKTMAKLLMELPDRIDHEPRIFPYLISGLYDQNDGIRKLVFEEIEELGLKHEEWPENIEKIREIRQFGYVPEWQYGGIIKDEHVVLPEPLVHRPRLGARLVVRSYVRRYLKALYNEIGDWIEEHAERASNLLLFSICYTEEFVTQYLDHMLIAMYRAILVKNKKIFSNVTHSLRLIGRYTVAKSYDEIISKAMRNEMASYYTFTQIGSLRCFGYLFAGSIELLQPGQDLASMAQLFANFIKSLKECIIDTLDIESSNYLLETLDIMLKELVLKKSQNVDTRMVDQYLPDLLNFLLKADCCYITYTLQKKEEPPEVKASREKVKALIVTLDEFGGKDYLDSRVVTIVDKLYGDILDKYTEYLEQERLKPKQIEEVVEEEPKEEEECPEPIIRDEDDEKPPERKEEEEEKQIDSKAEADPSGTGNGFIDSALDKMTDQMRSQFKEGMALVPTNKREPHQEVEEDLEVDVLLGIKSWTMQSATWRMLNVLLHHLSERQLEYKCGNGNTVFHNFMLLLRLGLMKAREIVSEEKGITQVKTFIMTHVFPKAVNLSLKLVNPEITLLYLDILS
jgi:hypothetical protein